jgi:hypothetical protein
VRVHIAGLAADVGFVGFDLAGQLVSRPHAEGKPNPVIHEPSRFLGDTKRPRNLATANAILAVGNQPRSRQPLVQSKGRIFVDRPGLQRELALRMFVPALPAVLLCQKDYIGAPARWAGNSVGPAARHNVLPAVDRIGEEYDGFLKAAGFSFHASSVADLARLVK